MKRDKVFKYIESHFDEHLARLQELLDNLPYPLRTVASMNVQGL
ncbi:MAG: hypothetical protein ACUVQX_07055 [Candidatus Bathycorpusculaceae bacterium]